MLLTNAEALAAKRKLQDNVETVKKKYIRREMQLKC